MVALNIANTVTHLIQGDLKEHLPFERIPLEGDVLGLGTTTSIDNGELAFLYAPAENRTRIYKCRATDGSISELRAGDGSGHFPYVCFTGDAGRERHPIDLDRFPAMEGRPLQQLIRGAIEQLGRPAPIYGIRLIAEWESLVITVASKLCMGQKRRNAAVSPGAGLKESIYDLLQHYRLAPEDSGTNPKIHYLGRSLEWECCGFYDTEPVEGRVTVPEEGAHLHIHGCSTDHRYGGHLHHEHGDTRLRRLKRLELYPLDELRSLGADLAVEELRHSGELLSFRIRNLGSMDTNDLGIAIVINDRYRDHRYLRLPWLSAGESQEFSVPLDLPAGRHEVAVVADPNGDVIEAEDRRANNTATLSIEC
jgi:hypothetical protein